MHWYNSTAVAMKASNLPAWAGSARRTGKLQSRRVRKGNPMLCHNLERMHRRSDAHARHAVLEPPQVDDGATCVQTSHGRDSAQAAVGDPGAAAQRRIRIVPRC